MAKATPLSHSDIREQHCPLSEPRIAAQMATCIRESNLFSLELLRFLASRSPEARTRWCEESVAVAEKLFHPWAFEIIFSLAVSEKDRFTELQGLLPGISSRTLADKLEMLRDAGYVERIVLDEKPVRTKYVLTKEGRIAAVLASSIFVFLSHRDEARPPASPGTS